MDGLPGSRTDAFGRSMPEDCAKAGFPQLAGKMFNRCCWALRTSVADPISAAKSSAPNCSAMASTQRFTSSQKANVTLKSSIGWTQHGNFSESDLLKAPGSPLYSKKKRTTMPMHARGSMKVGKIAGVSMWFSFFGDAHMKPAGSNLTRCRSFNSTDVKEASTNWRSARFSTRTREWKAVRSKSTSAFHMSFFSFMGTKDITRLKSRRDFVR
mmetsp:Transcript_124576/g.398856  ORF Transcript_124576/g.398856 Transcript_124576/m.398856 type:complete len:212 (-) Transcript_124576:1776-2411(-)